MYVDPTVKDKQNLSDGGYTLEIINAKTNTGKNDNAQLIIEYTVLDGPEYPDGSPSEGSEVTEFLNLEFKGYEGNGLRMMKEKLQDFVYGLDLKMEDFRDKEAEDLIGMKVNALLKNRADSNGIIRANITAHTPVA